MSPSPSGRAHPNRELAGFAKVQLRNRQTIRVRMRINPRELAYWDSKERGFAVQRGSYRITVGGRRGA